MIVAVEMTDDGFAVVANEARRFVDAGGNQATVAMLRLAPETAPAFGLHFVDTTPPDGQRHSGAFTDVDGVPTPVFEAMPPPAVVSAAQARIALLAANLLTSVTAAVDLADDATKIWFEYATEWRRDNPIVEALGSSLGLSSSDIDDLFRAAGAVAA